MHPGDRHRSAGRSRQSAARVSGSRDGRPPPLDRRADGTTQVAFTPTAFLARLAVLVPRPHVNLLSCHSVHAARRCTSRGGHHR